MLAAAAALIGAPFAAMALPKRRTYPFHLPMRLTIYDESTGRSVGYPGKEGLMIRYRHRLDRPGQWSPREFVKVPIDELEAIRVASRPREIL